MEQLPDSQRKPGRSRGLGRNVWVAYWTTGVVLAAFRVALWAWVEHQRVWHRMSETVYDLLWLLRPEFLLHESGLIQGVAPIRDPPRFIFWGVLLSLGGLILATPILWVGWLRQRRRYLATVAALAVARVAVLACAIHRFSSESLNGVFRRLRWALFPEAFLVTHTELGEFPISWMMTLVLGGAVLIWGTFLLATPILLLDGRGQRLRRGA